MTRPAKMTLPLSLSYQLELVKRRAAAQTSIIMIIMTVSIVVQPSSQLCNNSLNNYAVNRYVSEKDGIQCIAAHCLQHETSVRWNDVSDELSLLAYVTFFLLVKSRF
jgi:hypothetical protein